MKTVGYEKIYVINLERRPDRWTKVLESSKLLPQEIPLERIEAVDAKLNTQNQLCENSTSACCNFCLPSMIAVGMSHRKTWQKMLDDGIGVAMIFEDDFCLPVDFDQRMASIATSLPKDWKMLYLSCYGDCRNASTGNKLFSKLAVGDFLRIGAPQKINQLVSKASCPVILVAYMLTNQGARELLDLTQKISYHVDIQIARSKEFISSGVYQVNEPLVTQNPSDSDNTIVHQRHLIVNGAMRAALSKELYENYGTYANGPLFQIGGFRVDLIVLISILLVSISLLQIKKHKVPAIATISAVTLFTLVDFVFKKQ